MLSRGSVVAKLGMSTDRGTKGMKVWIGVLCAMLTVASWQVATVQWDLDTKRFYDKYVELMSRPPRAGAKK